MNNILHRLLLAFLVLVSGLWGCATRKEIEVTPPTESGIPRKTVATSTPLVLLPVPRQLAFSGEAVTVGSLRIDPRSKMPFHLQNEFEAASEMLMRDQVTGSASASLPLRVTVSDNAIAHE